MVLSDKKSPKIRLTITMVDVYLVFGTTKSTIGTAKRKRNALDNSILGLSTIRQNRGISLEQISESTKISMRSLRAIEGGEFGKLPGGIYNTNYIRQYARAIEFDEWELLAYYHSRTGSNPDSNSAPAARDRNLFRGGLHPATPLGSR
jgi:hypothetical protein